jgi:hypothetical protein
MTKPEYLRMVINYNVASGKFEVDSNMNLEGQIEMVDSFIRCQIGEGKDESEREERDVYTIRLQLLPEGVDWCGERKYESIGCTHDIGNESLREGILLKLLGELNGELEDRAA